MTVIGLLLKYIFIVAVLIAVFVIGVVVYFMHRVRHLAQQFSQTGNSQTGNNPGAQRAGTYGNSSNGGTCSSHSTAGGAGNASANEAEADEVFEEVDEELYDTRSPNVANRKIFAKDEGEYVDFEEE